MRKDLLLPIGGVLLVVLCCAAPFLIAGAGAALTLAALRAHLAVIIAPFAVAALIAAVFVVRTRRPKTNDDPSRARRS